MGLGRVVLLTPVLPGYGRTPKSVQLSKAAEAVAACLTPVHLSVFVSLVFVSRNLSLDFLSFCLLLSVLSTLSTLQICPKLLFYVFISPGCLSVSLHLQGLSLLQLLAPLSWIHSSALSILTVCHPLSLCLSPCIYQLLPLPLSLPIVEGVHGL